MYEVLSIFNLHYLTGTTLYIRNCWLETGHITCNSW